jgi:hypothetical protein
MSKPRLAMTLALSGLLLALAGGGCASQVFAAPPPATITPFHTLELVQLENDYVHDQAAADRLYLGQRWFFGLLRADQVVNSYFAVNTNEDYVQTGIVLFKPRASADIKGIIQGTTFQVAGDVQGYANGHISVINCWFQVVSGGRTSVGGGY